VQRVDFGEVQTLQNQNVDAIDPRVILDCFASLSEDLTLLDDSS
jgi:hypothetical protein